MFIEDIVTVENWVVLYIGQIENLYELLNSKSIIVNFVEPTARVPVIAGTLVVDVVVA
jgi:hypothetical protein